MTKMISKTFYLFLFKFFFIFENSLSVLGFLFFFVEISFQYISVFTQSSLNSMSLLQ